MDPIMRREIILENYQNPMNRGLIEDDSYIQVNTNNESCIDNLDIQYKIVDRVIQDIRFDGEACAISTSATSIMIKSLLGKTVEDAKMLLDHYSSMLEEKEYDAEYLQELNAYDEIYLQPNRKKCAMLPFESLKKVLDKIES